MTETVLQETSMIRREPFKGIARSSVQGAIWRLTREMKARGVIRAVYGCHDFRHYFGVKLYQETRDIYAVKQAMDHSSVAATETYLAGLGALEKEGVSPPSLKSS